MASEKWEVGLKREFPLLKYPPQEANQDQDTNIPVDAAAWRAGIKYQSKSLDSGRWKVMQFIFIPSLPASSSSSSVTFDDVVMAAE